MKSVPAAVSCAYSFPPSLLHLHPSHASGIGPSLDCIRLCAQVDSTRMVQFPDHSSAGLRLRVDCTGTIRTAMAIWLCDSAGLQPALTHLSSFVWPPRLNLKSSQRQISPSPSFWTDWSIYCPVFLRPLVLSYRWASGWTFHQWPDDSCHNVRILYWTKF